MDSGKSWCVHRAAIGIEFHYGCPARILFDADIATRSGGDVHLAVVKQNSAGGVAAPGGKIGEGFGIGCAEAGLVPVVAAILVVLGHVQLAFVEGQAVGLVQSGEDGHGRRRFAGMFRIRKRDHLAFTPLADQQNSGGREDHHAGAIHLVGKNRDMKSWRRLQLRQIEAGFLGASKRGVNHKQQEEWGQDQ